jgi:hypothetical protein
MIRLSVAAASLAALAALAAAAPTAAVAAQAGVSESPSSKSAASRMRQLKTLAAQAQSRINKSSEDKAALRAGVSRAQARDMLLRHGFTEEHLQGTKVVIGRKARGGSKAIELTVMPDGSDGGYEIVISI